MRRNDEYASKKIQIGLVNHKVGEKYISHHELILWLTSYHGKIQEVWFSGSSYAQDLLYEHYKEFFKIRILTYKKPNVNVLRTKLYLPAMNYWGKESDLLSVLKRLQRKKVIKLKLSITQIESYLIKEKLLKEL